MREMNESIQYMSDLSLEWIFCFRLCVCTCAPAWKVGVKTYFLLYLTGKTRNIEYTTQRADGFLGKQSCYFFFFTFSGPFLSISDVFLQAWFFSRGRREIWRESVFLKIKKYIYIYTYPSYSLLSIYLAFLSHSRTQWGKLGGKKSFNTRTYRFLLPLLLTWEDQLELNIFRSYLGRKNIGSWVWEARHYRQREILDRVARNRINRESEYWNSSVGKKWWMWRN